MSKKNTPEIQPLPLDHYLDFVPAEYKPGKENHIRYYARNPTTNKMVRIRIKINRIPDNEKKRYAQKQVMLINSKLYAGWNPFNLAHSTKGTNLIAAIELWRQNKMRDLRPNSRRSYISISGKFLKWLSIRNIQVGVEAFDPSFAKQYMAEIAATHALRTWNSNLGCIKGMFHWFIENDFCTENPFAKIKKRKPQEKSRQVIDTKTRTIIDAWMATNNPQLRLAASLIFYCLIRPRELTYLQIQHFNFENQTIWISPEASKNKKGDRVAIPNTALQSIRQQLDRLQLTETDFVFSSRETLSPGKTPVDSRYFSKHWNKMRAQLRFSTTYQLYSLKDTGIVQMLSDGVPPNEVMTQARHSDLKTTSEYLKHTTTMNTHHYVKTKTTSLAGND